PTEDDLRDAGGEDRRPREDRGDDERPGLHPVPPARRARRRHTCANGTGWNTVPLSRLGHASEKPRLPAGARMPVTIKLAVLGGEVRPGRASRADQCRATGALTRAAEGHDRK